MDPYPVWIVANGEDYDEHMATPHTDGTVTILGKNWDRARWDEFASQVNDLFDIAERGEDPA